jgi:hypothetical protein
MILKCFEIISFYNYWRQLATISSPFIFSYRVQRSLTFHIFQITVFRSNSYSLPIIQFDRASWALFSFSCSLKKGKHRPLFDAFRFILRRASSTIRLSSTSTKPGVFKPMLFPLSVLASHSFRFENSTVFSPSLAVLLTPSSSPIFILIAILF